MGDRRGLTQGGIPVGMRPFFRFASIRRATGRFDMAPSRRHVHTALDVYFFPNSANIHW